MTFQAWKLKYLNSMTFQVFYDRSDIKFAMMILIEITRLILWTTSKWFFLSTCRCPNASARCINTPGSYYCVCKSGWRQVSAYQCVDIDECSTGNYSCPSNSYCVNLNGSYRCDCNRCYYKSGPYCNRKSTILTQATQFLRLYISAQKGTRKRLWKRNFMMLFFASDWLKMWRAVSRMRNGYSRLISSNYFRWLSPRNPVLLHHGPLSVYKFVLLVI